MTLISKGLIEDFGASQVLMDNHLNLIKIHTNNQVLVTLRVDKWAIEQY